MRKLIILFLLISVNCFAQFNPFGDGVSLTNTSSTWIGTQTFDSIIANNIRVINNVGIGGKLTIDTVNATTDMITISAGLRVPFGTNNVSFNGEGGFSVVNQSLLTFISLYQDDGFGETAQITLNTTGGITLTRGATSLVVRSDKIDVGGSVLPSTHQTYDLGSTVLQFDSVFSKVFSENGTSLASKYAILGNTNTFVNDQIFSGRVRTDTVLNVMGSLTINDTTTITGRLNVTDDAFFSRDIVTLSTRGQVLGFNSSGTQGVYLNSTADNFLRIRNAGVSTDATVQIGRLIATNQTPISTASSTGTAGTIVIGTDSYIYICVATNTWVRALCLTW